MPNIFCMILARLTLSSACLAPCCTRPDVVASELCRVCRPIEILQLMKADIPVLNDIRAQLVGEANVSNEILPGLTRDNLPLS